MKDTEWFLELKLNYDASISNFFMIAGNINDYVIPGVMLKPYIHEKLKAVVGGNDSDITYYDISDDVNNTTFNSLCNKMASSSLENKNPLVLIINYPEFLIPNGELRMLSEHEKQRIIKFHKLVNSPEFLMSNNIIILIAETQQDIHSMFLSSTSRLKCIHLPYPDIEKRLETVEYLNTELEEQRIRFNIDDSDFFIISNEEFARSTAGLASFQIEDIYLKCIKLGHLDRNMILEKGHEIVNKEFGDKLQIYDTNYSLTLNSYAGMDYVKEYLMEGIIEPLNTGDYSVVPKGLLFMGPPGTGKTYLAKCIAGSCGSTFIELKISNFLSKWVGDPERDLRKALDRIISLGNCIVFIDEIDQVLNRSNNDSNGIRGNIFQMILSVMSEPNLRGRIIWIAATNYPNRIDEALKRAGRFDKKLVFLPPDSKERVQVFEFYIEKSIEENGIDYYIERDELQLLVDKTKGYTQAEIETIFVKALELIKRKKETVLSYELLNKAIDYVVTVKNHKIQEMIELAIDECNDKEFMPPNFKEFILDKV